LGIDGDSGLVHVLDKEGIPQALGLDQIDGSTQKGLDFLLEIEKIVKPIRIDSVVKLDHKIDIAFRAEFACDGRPERIEPLDMKPTAQIDQSCSICLKYRIHLACHLIHKVADTHISSSLYLDNFRLSIEELASINHYRHRKYGIMATLRVTNPDSAR
jgi:hypothetical protein